MYHKNKTFNISLSSILKPGILPFFILVLFIILFIPLLIYTYKTEKQLFAWLVAIFWLSSTFFPPFLLYIQYIINDHARCLEINNIEQLLTLTKGDIIQRINYADIVRIEKYHSKDKKDGYVSKMHWHSYYYYKIVIKDLYPIFITRMLIEKFENEVDGIEFKSIRVNFPIIKK